MSKFNRLGLFLTCSLLAPVLACFAQSSDERLTPHTDNKLPYQYLQYLPADYGNDTAQKYPLVLFLHGAGERGDDLEKIKIHGIPKRIANGDDFPFILIAPQCPEKLWWDTESLNKLLDKILAANNRIDRDHVYLTGLSMGGFGTWALGSAYPKKFAALVPICGGGDVSKADAIKKIPIWVFHGDQDKTVPAQKSIDMVEALKKVDANIQFTLYPGVGHDSWTETYNNPKLYEWLLEQNRQKQ